MNTTNRVHRYLSVLLSGLASLAGALGAKAQSYHWAAPDRTFAPTIDGRVTAMAVQPDGRIVIAGAFAHVNGVSQLAMARLNLDGSLDTRFAQKGWQAEEDSPSEVQLGLQKDGRIVVFARTAQGNRSLRLNPDGTKDSGFVAPDLASGDLIQLLVTAQDELVLLRYGTPALIRLRSDGSADPSFSPVNITSGDGAYAIAADLTGGYFLAGDFQALNGVAVTNLVHLRSDGTLDPTFVAEIPRDDTGAPERVTGVTPTGNGGPIVATTAYDPSTSNSQRLSLFRLLPNGRRDPSFYLIQDSFSTFKSGTSRQVIRLDDDCFVVGQSTCSIGGCWNTAGLIDGRGNWTTYPSSDSSPIRRGGGGGLNLLQMASRDVWYASVIDAFTRFTMVRDHPSGVGFAESDVYVTPGEVALLSLRRYGDTSIEGTARYDVTAADGAADFTTRIGIVSIASSAAELSLALSTAGVAVPGAERILQVELRESPTFATVDFRRVRVHLVNDAEQARAPHLRITRLGTAPTDDRVSLELRHFALGQYELQSGPSPTDLQFWNIVDIGPWALVGDATPTAIDDRPLPLTGQRFYRALRLP